MSTKYGKSASAVFHSDCTSPVPLTKHAAFLQGISCLFHGLPGTGKTMAAECLGFEMGKPIKFVNCAELVNKYIGETGKNIEKVRPRAEWWLHVPGYLTGKGLETMCPVCTLYSGLRSQEETERLCGGLVRNVPVHTCIACLENGLETVSSRSFGGEVATWAAGPVRQSEGLVGHLASLAISPLCFLHASEEARSCPRSFFLSLSRLPHQSSLNPSTLEGPGGCQKSERTAALPLIEGPICVWPPTPPGCSLDFQILRGSAVAFSGLKVSTGLRFPHFSDPNSGGFCQRTRF
jgi:hypothetical protein